MRTLALVCRRLILSASGRYRPGLADLAALPLAVARQQAVEFVGTSQLHLHGGNRGALLALARKSNSTYAAYHNAAEVEVRDNGPQPVPLHGRNAATAMQRQWGYGHGYKYPPRFPEANDQDYFGSTPCAARRSIIPRNVVEPYNWTQGSTVCARP